MPEHEKRGWVTGEDPRQRKLWRIHKFLSLAYPQAVTLELSGQQVDNIMLVIPGILKAYEARIHKDQEHRRKLDIDDHLDRFNRWVSGESDESIGYSAHISAYTLRLNRKNLANHLNIATSWEDLLSTISE